MSRLHQSVRPKTSVQTRLVIGAVGGLVAAAMFLFVITQQNDDGKDETGLRTFSKTYADLTFKKVIATHDGHMLSSDGTNFHKLDSNGNVLWSAKVLPPQPVLIQELLETTDHGVVAVAQTAAQTGASRIYVIKMQPDGTFGWSRMLEKIQSEFAYGACASDDNGVYLCGSGCFTFNYVLKLNAGGDQVWIKDYTVTGGTLSAQRILKTETGLMLTGRLSQGTNNSLYIARLDNNGQWLGGKTFSIDHQPQVKSFVRASDGGFVLAGHLSGNNAGGFVMKTDNSGNPTWFRGLQASDAQSINAVASTNDNSILCVGNMFVNQNENVNMWLTKLDPNGNLLWSATMGSDELNGAGYDDLHGIAAMPNNRFMLTGYSNGGLVGITDAAGNGFCHYTDASVTVSNLPIQTQIFTPTPILAELFSAQVLSLASSYTAASAPSVCYGNFTGTTNTIDTTTISSNDTTAEEEAEITAATNASVTVNIYPNPTKGDCDVDIRNLNSEAVMQLFDRTGQKVLEQRIPPSQQMTRFSLSHLPSGTYGVSVKSNDWVYHQGQIVLQR